ncbi:MAG TPA: hypothetical protein VNH82_01955 [Candidatus Dormibacteraeota bacterium]|nr:hypothetical protein [Candidatus Dormibacteraeota bacterium]
MSELEMPAPGPVGTVLPPPKHPELPAEVVQVFVEVDRKCGVFIFPQLRQLGAGEAVEELVAAAGRLAETVAEGAGGELLQGYRELLSRAQAALREARTAEVRQEEEHREERQTDAQIAAALLSAKSRLPAPRLAKLQRQLAEMADGEGGDRVAAVERAVAEWERLSQVRQSREAERLAERAHRVVEPRQQQTARSRRALREQAKVVELARAFVLEDGQPLPATESDSAGQ